MIPEKAVDHIRNCELSSNSSVRNTSWVEGHFSIIVRWCHISSCLTMFYLASDWMHNLWCALPTCLSAIELFIIEQYSTWQHARWNTPFNSLINRWQWLMKKSHQFTYAIEKWQPTWRGLRSPTCVENRKSVSRNAQ